MGLAGHGVLLQFQGEIHLVGCCFVSAAQREGLNFRTLRTQATPAELKQLTTVFGDRDAAIKQGLVIGGMRYEVRTCQIEEPLPHYAHGTAQLDMHDT